MAFKIIGRLCKKTLNHFSVHVENQKRKNDLDGLQAQVISHGKRSKIVILIIQLFKFGEVAKLKN